MSLCYNKSFRSCFLSNLERWIFGGLGEKMPGLHQKTFILSLHTKQHTNSFSLSIFFPILLIPSLTKHMLRLLKMKKRKKKRVEIVTHNNNYTHTYVPMCIHKSWYKCMMVVLKLFDYISKNKKKKLFDINNLHSSRALPTLQIMLLLYLYHQKTTH